MLYFTPSGKMPATDVCEPQVVRALEKAGWTVVRHHYPMFIPALDRYLLADLLIEHGQATAMIVEIKCFQDQGRFHDDFYHAVGQYMTYRSLLRLNGDSYPLYLSVPLETFEVYFDLPHIKAVIDDARIQMVVIDLAAEEVSAWLT